MFGFLKNAVKSLLNNDNHDDDNDNIVFQNDSHKIQTPHQMMSAAQATLTPRSSLSNAPYVKSTIDFENAKSMVEMGSGALLLTTPAHLLCTTVTDGPHKGKSYLWLLANEAANGRPKLFEAVLINKDLRAAMNHVVLQSLEELADEAHVIGGVSFAHLLEDSDDEAINSAGTIVDNTSEDDINLQTSTHGDKNNANLDTTAKWLSASPDQANLRQWKIRQNQLKEQKSARPNIPAPAPSRKTSRKHQAKAGSHK